MKEKIINIFATLAGISLIALILRPVQPQATERCWRIAEELLISGYDIPSNVLYQAEFKQGSGVYKKVQNMYFCYK